MKTENSNMTIGLELIECKPMKFEPSDHLLTCIERMKKYVEDPEDEIDVAFYRKDIISCIYENYLKGYTVQDISFILELSLDANMNERTINKIIDYMNYILI